MRLYPYRVITSWSYFFHGVRLACLIIIIIIITSNINIILWITCIFFCFLKSQLISQEQQHQPRLEDCTNLLESVNVSSSARFIQSPFARHRVKRSEPWSNVCVVISTWNTNIELISQRIQFAQIPLTSIQFTSFFSSSSSTGSKFQILPMRLAHKFAQKLDHQS